MICHRSFAFAEFHSFIPERHLTFMNSGSNYISLLYVCLFWHTIGINRKRMWIGHFLSDIVQRNRHACSSRREPPDFPLSTALDSSFSVSWMLNCKLQCSAGVEYNNDNNVAMWRRRTRTDQELSPRLTLTARQTSELGTAAVLLSLVLLGPEQGFSLYGRPESARQRSRWTAHGDYLLFTLLR